MKKFAPSVERSPFTPPERMTAHFRRSEFACPCCGKAQVTQGLVSALETVRLIVGVPVRVNSGYRCPEHNRKVGGAPNSQHVQGIAADISAECGWRALYEAALRVPAFEEGGIGVYPESNFVHLDVRPEKARWARLHGKYVGIDQALA